MASGTEERRFATHVAQPDASDIPWIAPEQAAWVRQVLEHWKNICNLAVATFTRFVDSVLDCVLVTVRHKAQAVDSRNDPLVAIRFLVSCTKTNRLPNRQQIFR